jgi:biotin carboxylase
MLENLKGKKLLIMGGITPMVEVVERCHELGIIVYVTDYLENSPAKKYADKSFMVSATDIEAMVKLCKEEKIDGLYTGNADILLPYYAKICEEANLPCYGTSTNFDIMTDKKKFKDCCRKYNVPTIPEYYSIEDVDEYPVLVKPIDSSGSRGISVCYTKEELERGIKKALDFSRSKQYLIEKYMTGAEVVLYYYFQDGNPVFAGMCDRYVLKQDTGLAQLPTAYIFPSKYTENHIDKTDALVKNMFKEIGMTNGPIFLQGFIENGIAHIYEPGYRTNGAREQYIIGEVTGVSSMDMLIQFALTGKMADFDIEKKIDPKLHGKKCCKLSPLIGKGEIASIEGIEKLKCFKGVVKTVLNNRVSEEITDKNLGTLKQVGYRSFIVSENYKELAKAINDIQNTVVFRDSNGNSMMLQGFDVSILEEYEQ